MQMPSPQKQKGSSWEREVAEFFSKTFNEHFMKSPGSGAYVGGNNAIRKQHMHEDTIKVFKGDIVPGESFSHLNVECKSYKDFPFHQLIMGKTIKQLDDWINQCMTVADADDLCMLLLKFNRKGAYVVVPKKHNFHLLPHSVEYQSQKHGIWIFSELTEFFNQNKIIIKEYSQKVKTHTSAKIHPVEAQNSYQYQNTPS
jgi:Holliday junction resolvase